MKRILLALCTLALVAGEAVTAQADCNNPNCRACVARRHTAAAACPPNRGICGGLFGSGGLFGNGAGNGAGYGMMPPPSPTVVYPYYTTRAPRDFLSANPRGIGP
ncbi:MAG: hypothetical protein JNL96_05410 [Planctomycetaceae bacterium]|nr:hypothetical protein [Planctomycetaceae bacterium]